MKTSHPLAGRRGMRGHGDGDAGDFIEPPPLCSLDSLPAFRARLKVASGTMGPTIRPLLPPTPGP